MVEIEQERKRHILRILSLGGLISEEQVEDILAHEEEFKSQLINSNEWGFKNHSAQDRLNSSISVLDMVAHKGYTKIDTGEVVTEQAVMNRLADYYGRPFIQLNTDVVDLPLLPTIVNKNFAIDHELIPLKLEGTTLTLATSNPFSHEGINKIRSLTNYELELVITTKSDIVSSITRLFGDEASQLSNEGSLEDSLAEEPKPTTLDLSAIENHVIFNSPEALSASDGHVIETLEAIINFAIELKASDIYIAPSDTLSYVSIRLNGAGLDVAKFPIEAHKAVLSLIKALCGMEPDGLNVPKAIPGAGSFKQTVSAMDYSVRATFLPTASGERVSMRLHNPRLAAKGFDLLGFDPSDADEIRSMLGLRRGLIVISGRSHSGKTTTAYSALLELASQGRSVFTLENPIEIYCDELVQSPEFDSESHSRIQIFHVLHHSPDVVFLGSIRDHGSALAAVNAVQSGRLVISTMDCSSVVETTGMLTNLGISPAMLSSILEGVVTQALVKAVCQNCKLTISLSPEEAQSLGLKIEPLRELQVSKGLGCEVCNGTGYDGVKLIAGTLSLDEELKSLIEEGKAAGKFAGKFAGEFIKTAESKGFKTLRQTAIEKMLAGETTYDEVIRL